MRLFGLHAVFQAFFSLSRQIEREREREREMSWALCEFGKKLPFVMEGGAKLNAGALLRPFFCSVDFRAAVGVWL